MSTILRAVRVRFLRRRPHSSVSLLTALDIQPERYPELQEQYASLLDCVWQCEREAARTDHQEQLFG